MRRREGTLRNKLLRWLLIPLSVLFLIDAAGSYIIANKLAERVHDRELMEIARELALHIKRSGSGLTFDLENDAERMLLLDQYDQLFFAVRDPSGVLIAGDPALTRSNAGEFGTTAFYDAEMHGDQVRVATLRTGQGADTFVPPAVVQVAETRVKRRALAEEILIDVIIPQLVLILIAGLMVWVGVARGLAPLSRLREQVAARSHLDLTPVEGVDVPSEVHPLLQAVNDLMARLNEVLTFQRRFIADAAHQLRTPVAGLKAHIELALREDDSFDAKQSLTYLYAGVVRVSRLVSQLLSLARYEADAVKKRAFSKVDLSALAFDASSASVPEAYARKIDLGFEGAGEPVMVDGDPVGLRELLNNLLDNAIRYSHEGGRVTIRVSGHPNPQMSVSDDGPSIPVEERERVFQRFHRLLGSYTSGTGLGLAIVREIASLHNAEVTVTDDADGRGNVFTVTFHQSERN
jgi:two-component system sensor histidine kinase TctE